MQTDHASLLSTETNESVVVFETKTTADRRVRFNLPSANYTLHLLAFSGAAPKQKRNECAEAARIQAKAKLGEGVRNNNSYEATVGQSRDDQHSGDVATETTQLRSIRKWSSLHTLPLHFQNTFNASPASRCQEAMQFCSEETMEVR